VIDLGTDVEPRKFVDIADDVKVIALSALLTTSMFNIAAIEVLSKAGKCAKEKVIIGGASIAEAYARQIGVYGYAPDASRAEAVI
jgi:methanogenic corrinoid protein MtbC1